MSLLEILKSAEQSGRASEADKSRIFGEYIERSARLVGSPRAGVLELTPRCNFDCKMCYVHLEKDQMKGVSELPKETWIRLIDEAIENGMIAAEMTGGEAMLHPGFDDIYLHMWDRGIRMSVMTNGLLLNDERIEFFRKHPPSSIQVSLYGNSEEQYERLTGVRAYGRVVANILSAKDIGCIFAVTTTPSRFFTAADVEKSMEFARANGIRFRVNSELYAPREDTGRRMEDIDLTNEQYADVLRIRLKHAGKEIKPFEGVLPQTGTGEDSVGEDGFARGVGCSSGRSLFCINWKGEMMACLDLAIKEKPLEIGFKEAWRRIHEQATRYIVPMECPECPYVRVCNPCPVLHAHGAPEGHADPRICERTKKLVGEGLLEI